jgi:hypothetical protein
MGKKKETKLQHEGVIKLKIVKQEPLDTFELKQKRREVLDKVILNLRENSDHAEVTEMVVSDLKLTRSPSPELIDLIQSPVASTEDSTKMETDESSKIATSEWPSLDSYTQMVAHTNPILLGVTRYKIPSKARNDFIKSLSEEIPMPSSKQTTPNLPQDQYKLTPIDTCFSNLTFPARPFFFSKIPK